MDGFQTFVLVMIASTLAGCMSALITIATILSGINRNLETRAK